MILRIGKMMGTDQWTNLNLFQIVKSLSGHSNLSIPRTLMNTNNLMLF